MLRIVCVKVGTAYGAEYVNILRDMVLRNLPEGYPGQFECFTDDRTGLDPAIVVRDVPYDLTGWWAKLWLFKYGHFNDNDRVLYFDLDTVIVGALDAIVKYDGLFAILRDFYRPDGLQSSVMAWKANTCGFIWDWWDSSMRPRPDGGDQEWIERCAAEGFRVDIWQDLYPKAFVSFKAECQPMPPRGAKVCVFHGQPRPHNCEVDWVAGVWAIGGGQGFDLEQICNTRDEQIFGNVRKAVALKHDWLKRVEPHDGIAVICAGGPSLLEKIDEIRIRALNHHAILAVNGVANVLRSHGIGVDYHALLDARPETAEFVSEPHAWTEYLVASQCDEAVFAALSEQEVTVWHPLIPGIEQSLGDDPRPVHLVGGGSTVGLKAIVLAYLLGYRNFHLYGFDSCYNDGKHHAYAQPLNDADRVLDVQVGARTFKAAPWMVTQANEFQDLAAQLANMGCVISVAGDGLLAFVVCEMMKPRALNGIELRASAILSRLPSGPVTGAEIGVFAGDLSAALLSRPDLTLYMVDSWKGGGADYVGDTGDFHAALTQDKQDQYRQHAIMAVEFAKDRRTVLAMSSADASQAVQDGTLDFVFIDADHSYEGCSADIAAWLPKVKAGGLICGHDYDHPEYTKFGVKRAVDEFAAKHGLTIDLGDNMTWFITKPASMALAA